LNHEVLHVIMNHKEVLSDYFKIDPKLANIGADMCINSLLMSTGMWNKKSMTKLSMSMVTPKDYNLPELQSSRWYCDQLMGKYLRSSSNSSEFSSNSKMRDHVHTESTDKIVKQDQDRGQLSDEEVLKVQRSFNTEGMYRAVKPIKDFSKYLVSEVVGNYKKQMTFSYHDMYGINSTSLVSNGKILMESPILTEDIGKVSKSKVAIILDVSPSCEAFIPIFISAVEVIEGKFASVDKYLLGNYTRMIDKDKDYKDVVRNTHDCSTRYRDFPDVIDENKYDNIIVFTDGYGNKYSCKHPEKWIWMLHSDCGIKYSFIIPKSKMLILSDYFRF